MSEVTNHLFDTIDRQNAHESAATRRTLVKTTAAALGTMGLLGYASKDAFAAVKTDAANSVENITTVAATAEVLATIVNTVGPEKLAGKLDAVTLRRVTASSLPASFSAPTVLTIVASTSAVAATVVMFSTEFSALVLTAAGLTAADASEP